MNRFKPIRTRAVIDVRGDFVNELQNEAAKIESLRVLEPLELVQNANVATIRLVQYTRADQLKIIAYDEETGIYTLQRVLRNNGVDTPIGEYVYGIK